MNKAQEYEDDLFIDRLKEEIRTERALNLDAEKRINELEMAMKKSLGVFTSIQAHPSNLLGYNITVSKKGLDKLVEELKQLLEEK